MATVTPLTLEMALEQLHALADPAVLASQVHFASHPAQALGVRIPQLRALPRPARPRPGATIVADRASRGAHSGQHGG